MSPSVATWSHLARRALEAWAVEFDVEPSSIVRIDAALKAPGRAERLRRGDAQCPDLFVEGLSSRPLHDPASLPAAVAGSVGTLESAAPAIGAEFRALRTSEASRQEPEAAHLATGNLWSRLDVLGRAGRDGSDLMPNTRAALLADPEIVSFGAAHVSILGPGSRIRPHYGPHNGRLRLHLGLEVPERCGLRVDDVSTGWVVGRVTAFDDSFVHEVWNDSPGDRAVLIVDVWHPDLTAAERAALAFVLWVLPRLDPTLVGHPGAPTFHGGAGR